MCPLRLHHINCVEWSARALLRLRLLTRLSSVVCPVRDVKIAGTRCEVPVAPSNPKNASGDLTKQFKFDYLIIDHLLRDILTTVEKFSHIVVREEEIAFIVSKLESLHSNAQTARL